MTAASAPLGLGADTIDLLFPLHLRLDSAGRIESIGPTMARVIEHLTTGTSFFDVFRVDRPRRITDMDGIRGSLGKKLSISGRLASGDFLSFRCVACGIECSDHLLVDFSFGENLAEVMTRFHLTTTDFRPNDMSIDMLFVLEAQKALLEDSQALTAALSQAKESAERAANVDPLTGIANRRAFNEYMARLCDASSEATEYALLHIDLNKFKGVNDTFGHAAGDAVLKHTAGVLTSAIGPGDMAARIGGDEFALVLSAPARNDQIETKIGTLISQISSPVRVGEQVLRINASVGVSRFHPALIDHPDQPLIESDIALYESKELKTPIVFLTAAMLARHMETSDTVQELETGVAEGQFIPFFQPQLDLETGAAVGLEVLARWAHPRRGTLAPGHWIEVATRAGLMPPIDRLVMRRALGHFSQWRAAGHARGKLSFNITLANLLSPDFTESLVDDLMSAGISADEVQLELLESILFDDADTLLKEQCERLKSAGFRLALDDFGTGHASIATLIDMPISVLKIDRSFVTGLDQKPKLQRITKSILAMSAEIGMKVIAEGVERQEELDLIAQLGCRYVQGYLVSRPLDADSCLNWLLDHAVSPRVRSRVPPAKARRPHYRG